MGDGAVEGGPLVRREAAGLAAGPEAADDDIEGAGDGEEGEVQGSTSVGDGLQLDAGWLVRLDLNGFHKGWTLLGLQEAEAEPRGHEGGEQAGEPYAGGVSYDQGGRRKLSYLLRETSDKPPRTRLSSAVVSGIWRRSQGLARTKTGEKGGRATGATDLEKGAAADEKGAKGGKASRV